MVLEKILDIIPATLVVTIIGALGYYFGRIIWSQKCDFGDNFNIYFEGMLFIASFIVFPAFIGIAFGLKFPKEYLAGATTLTSLLNLIIFIYLYFKTYGTILEKWELTKIIENAAVKKLKNKYRKKDITKALSVLKRIGKAPSQWFLLFLSIILVTTVFLPIMMGDQLYFALNATIAFISFTWIAIIYGAKNKVKFVEIELKNGKKINGHLWEVNENFIRVINTKEFVSIIPINEVSIVKTKSIFADMS